jgi:hypothetical protein
MRLKSSMSFGLKAAYETNLDKGVLIGSSNKRLELGEGTCWQEGFPITMAGS